MTSLSQKPKSLEVKSGPTFGLSVKSLINLVMGSLHILIVITGLSVLCIDCKPSYVYDARVSDGGAFTERDTKRRSEQV